MKRTFMILMALVLVIGIAVPATVMGTDALPNSIKWDGQGSDSLRCDKLGESPERTEDGWIHWIVTQASGVTEAELVLGGTGSGTYSPTKYGPVVEFFTPYYEVDGLTAILYYSGALEGNTQFVISDYCDGVAELQALLTVTKTVVTSYTRTHYWDIAKSVETENGYEHEGYPKVWLYIDGSGNETATWTVDVTYVGYEDSGYNVSGDITIVNDGNVDVEITGVSDVLCGEQADVSFGVSFPYIIEVGEILTGTYSYDGFCEGTNVVTVTTSLTDDEGEFIEFDGAADIVWGDPTTEVNSTVTVKDISEMFGEVELGSVTAPENAQFTYTMDFAWADYGADGCGSYTYNNTATIVETGQEASATLKVNVQCYVYETAYAKGDPAICFIPTFANWGWTNPIEPGEYTWDLWAGAAQCDTSKGTLVGSVTVVYDADGYVTVTYNVDSPFTIEETHVYAGYTMFPEGRRGQSTVAPGQYYNAGPFDGSQVYVIAHAVVGLPDPNFGP